MILREVAPPRPLVVLTVVVLVAHLIALRGTAPTFTAPAQRGGQAMTIRTISTPIGQNAPAATGPSTATSEQPTPALPAAPTVAPTAVPSPPSPVPTVTAEGPTRPLPPPPREPTVVYPADGPEPRPPTPEPATKNDATPNSSTDASAAGTRPARESGSSAANFRVPASVKLRYEVVGEARNQPYKFQGTLAWSHNGQQYQASQEFGALFIGGRSRSSVGRITADGLEPERFSDKARTEVAAHFNRSKGEVSFSANTASAPLLTGAQDQLSVILQLAAMIGGEPYKYPKATTITIQTVGPREADTWLFTVDGLETLELPGGKLNALKLTRNPRREFDQKVELWLAPDMDYLPARLRITQANGDFADQRWRSTERP